MRKKTIFLPTENIYRSIVYLPHSHKFEVSLGNSPRFATLELAIQARNELEQRRVRPNEESEAFISPDIAKANANLMARWA